jgi:transposase
VSVVSEAEGSTSTREDVPENVCEIEFDHARLRIRGNVSPDLLRLLIRELSR